MSERQQFTTRFGAVAAAVGSAVGLGNIWRFPYEAGTHGGGAFILVYLLFVIILGIPVITAEFIIGRHSGCNVYGTFRRLKAAPIWHLIGFIGIISSIMILSFYSVVAGWTLKYLVSSIANFGQHYSQATLHEQFGHFISSWQATGFTLAVLLINYLILHRGVQKGIEHMSNIMMPLLFVLLLVFSIHSLTLPQASRGIEFLFRPDFSSINSNVMLAAMGQAFFSLSIGLGCLITYASYFSKRERLLSSAVTIAGLDTLVAILAGVIIFPAVFSFGESPAAGPKLVFEVLPAIFGEMNFGSIWSILFFALLLLASLTSTISMGEISIAFFAEELHLPRKAATAAVIGICAIFGTLCALSFGPLSGLTLCGKSIFDLFDFVASNILLPLGGILISLFAGRVLGRTIVDKELHGVPHILINLLLISLRFIAPVLIALVFISGLNP